MMTVKKLIRTAALTSVTMLAMAAWSFTPSEQPPESTAVPGNVLLALSVEFPTGLQVSYGSTNYSSVIRYDGYFDNRKCYTYNTTNEVFRPTSAATEAGACASTEWSGNLLNWLTMTNLDQFRSVMTGGTRDNFSSMNASHPGDTVDRTVLIRSFSDRNSYNPQKRLLQTDPIPSALRSATAKYVRSGGYGSKFIVSNADNFADMNATQQRDTCAATPLPGAARTSWCFNIRVEACIDVGGLGREANCEAKYVNGTTGATVAKPEGLIQAYATRLRFGAFGYLNETGNDRNGGVMRSAMKSVGPVAATSTGVVANPNLEWNQSSGVMLSNPDPVDAAASGVSNSGLMNYLNKFGYAAGYKGNDPVSELYYAALRYLRGYALPTEYTNNLTTAGLDGFPVITGSAHRRGGSRDPMINTCQKNFILSIGDIYTHCDGNLPGSTRANCAGGTPSDPGSLNAESLWDNLRDFEGMPDSRDSSGVNGWAGGSGSPTPYVAGFAHWANTTDIRSDISGTQTVSTYFVDVLENGNGVGGWPAAGTLRTQYWLAAKYGGFDMTVANSTNPNVSSTSWDKDGNGVPDTWFAGSTPSLLKSGLSAAFADIAARSSANSASSAAVSSSRQTSDSQIIYAGYNPQNWTGTVTACRTGYSAALCASSPTWEASAWLNASTTATFVSTPISASTRKVFASWQNTATFAFSTMPFQWMSLATEQRTILNAADAQGANRLAYIRGDRSLEASIFRARGASVLGDVVHSGVTYVSGPPPALRYAGHGAYRVANRGRPPVVYVGANDGMLHAFSGSNGRELFAYIPSAVFNNLPDLTALNFRHQYFVDSTPMFGDVQQGSGWATILVGGLGAGGRGYYALNITDQSSFAAASETALSRLPMWEFTSRQDPELGYTFNEPSTHPVTGVHQQIAKVADANITSGVWRVVVGNGYGSLGGKAVLFMLNANTGAADIKLDAATGPENGLSTPTPVDTDLDGLVDTVYAGDLAGSMHKFQFSRLAGSNYVLARPGQSGAAWRYIGRIFASGEPVTTAPSVAPACTGVGWNVAFGSGKLNEDTDYGDNSRRGFYAVRDEALSTSLTVSSNELATITYSTMPLSSGNVGRTWTTPNLTNMKGWKMFFSPTSNPTGERVLTNSTMPPDTGVVLFATTRPSGDVCTPGNSGYIMAVNLCTGGVGNLIIAGQTTGGIAIDSTGNVMLSNTYTDERGKPTVVCNQDDCKDDPPKLSPVMAPRGRYNWREILTK